MSKKAKIYLSFNDEGRVTEWCAHLRADDITVGVTKDTLKPEVYADGWLAYYDDLSERGFSVELFEHHQN